MGGRGVEVEAVPRTIPCVVALLTLGSVAVASGIAQADPVGIQTPAGPILRPVQVAVGTDGNDSSAGWVSHAVRFPSRRTGASLHGVVFTPEPVPSGSLPAVVVAPGSGGFTEAGFRWAARDLAAHGYVALTVDPQGVGRSEPVGEPPCGMPAADDPRPCTGVPFQQAENYLDAITSAVDALTADVAQDWAQIDETRVGVAGHSLSARAAGYLQGVDDRIAAVVAWDNLASDLHGDEGSASGSRTASTFVDGDLPGVEIPVTPRVPALGMANGGAGSTTPTERDPENKKAGFNVWWAAGVPSFELVFASANHGSWYEPVPGERQQRERQLRFFAHYTRAWFDRWLRGDTSATAALLTDEIDGVSVISELSTSFRSAAFLDGVDCPDLRQCLANDGP